MAGGLTMKIYTFVLVAMENLTSFVCMNTFGVCYAICVYTLSGFIGKVVASHAEGCKVERSNPVCGGAAPIYSMHEALRGYCP